MHLSVDSGGQSLVKRTLGGGREYVEYAPFTPSSCCGMCGRDTAEHIEQLLDVADSHPEPINDDVLEALANFATILRRAEGRTVMIPKVLLDAVYGVANDVRVVTHGGVIYHAQQVDHIRQMFRSAIQSGTTGNLWDMTAKQWEESDLDGLIEYETGKLHAVRDGRLYCSSAAVDDADVLRDVNLARIFAQSDACSRCAPSIRGVGDAMGGGLNSFLGYIHQHYDK